MPDYEAQGFEPPAPIARAVVVGPESLAVSDVPLLIDTGSDVSIVPRSVAEAVGAVVTPSSVPIQFYDGGVTILDQAELRVEILRYRFHGVFLVTSAEYGVLGRNILNLLLLTLNGPRLQWSI